jgi:uncharacterized protein (DUF433 family)
VPLTLENSHPKLIDQPLYTPWDAARYLHLSLGAFLSVLGQSWRWMDPEPLFRHWRRFSFPFHADDDAPIRLRFEGNERLSFRRLSELFVRAATIQVFTEELQLRGGDNVEGVERLWRIVERGLEAARSESIQFDSDHDLIAAKLLHTFEFEPRIEQRSRKWILIRLSRIEFTEEGPVRLYPFSREPADECPKLVAIDPRVRFGRPTLVESALPTDALFDRFRAGDSVEVLAKDYSVTASKVMEAIRFESLAPQPAASFLI